MNVRGNRFGVRLAVVGGARHSVRAVLTHAGVGAHGVTRPALRAFTLIELILVMTLLIVVMAFSMPSLGNFFRGRALDAEARRLLSLTREGQSRAAAEGIPVILWVDANEREYGLEQDLTYVEHDDKAVTFTLDHGVRIEVINGVLSGMASTAGNARDLPGIRFEPDGSFADTSPEALQLQDRDGATLYLTQSRNKLSYEIRNQQAQR